MDWLSCEHGPTFLGHVKHCAARMGWSEVMVPVRDQSAADLVRFEFGGPAKPINGFTKSARVIKWPADLLERYQREDGSSDSARKHPRPRGLTDRTERPRPYRAVMQASQSCRCQAEKFENRPPRPTNQPFTAWELPLVTSVHEG